SLSGRSLTGIYDHSNATAENRDRRADKNFKVTLERPMLDVLDVQAHHLIEGEAITSTHLPQASHARQYIETAAVPVLIHFDFVENGRARTDYAHFAAQHVDDLRQLVDAETSKESAQPCNSPILSDLEEHLLAARERPAFPNPLACVVAMRLVAGSGPHGAELEQLERLTVHSGAELPEQNRPPVD